MRAVDLIRKKRDGGELSREEIEFLVRGCVTGEIPDYQTSALLMAIFFRSMTDAETAALTEAMRRSGTVVDLTSLPGRKVDKHSTGGVGDKTSLILAPALAAAGLIVPMISGRGLGHTGGTLDKLESIPGFNVNLTLDEFREALAEVGAGLIGQTADLVPADRKLYALRDVTSTVECIPLIVASIMSKKLAEGADALVLDVKTGSGAFMKKPEDSERLARAMVAIGQSCGTKVVALVTDMSQPLGELSGNSVEVIESIDVLRGGGPEDLVTLCRELAAHAFALADEPGGLEAGRARYDEVIRSGAALEKLREIIRRQGGDAGVVDDTTRLPFAGHEAPLASPARGYVESIDTERFGVALSVLGGGRETIDSIIDPAVGIRIHKKIGDRVAAGEPLCTVYYNDSARLRAASEGLLAAYRFAAEPTPRPKLIRKVIE